MSRAVDFARLAWVTIATALFALTAWFGASTFFEQPGRQANLFLRTKLDISFSNTVVILRVLQGLTSAATAVTVSQAYEGIQWNLSSRETGLRLHSFLSLSPSTGLWGVVQLGFAARQQPGDRAFAILRCGLRPYFFGSHIMANADTETPLSRLFLHGVLFVASIALFSTYTTGARHRPVSNRFTVGTSTTTAYRTLSTMEVTAGTGSFNGSMVEPFVASFSKQVPFWALASTYNFVTNSQFSHMSQPVACSDLRCDSYLFPGGTYLMFPPTPTDGTIVIHDAPGTQIEFSKGLGDGDRFLAQDCVVYGSEKSLVGVYFCLAASRVKEGSIIAGMMLEGAEKNGLIAPIFTAD